jgi:hypothetical protein
MRPCPRHGVPNTPPAAACAPRASQVHATLLDRCTLRSGLTQRDASHALLALACAVPAVVAIQVRPPARPRRTCNEPVCSYAE